MKKIEDRIAEGIADLVFHAMGKGFDTNEQNHEASVQSTETAKSILALISRVECGDCSPFLYHPQINGRRGLKWNSQDGEVFCPPCNGTGYRKVMVRRWCPETKERLGHQITSPYTHADLLDVINETATLELEGEG